MRQVRIAVRVLSALLVVGCVMWIPIAPASAQGSLSGMVFADYFYNLQGSGVTPDSSAFRFRRVYFTYDNNLDTVFAVRLQLEADQTELTSKGKSGVFVKQAFLRWKDLGGAGDLHLGMSPTPLWGTAEQVWGYRSIEKTVLDLNGFGAPTDIGVSLQRAPAAGSPVGYHLMFANGAGQKPDNDRSKKTYVSVPVRMDALTIEAVADYEGGPGSQDRYTLKLFGGWQQEGSAFGVEVFQRTNLNAGTAGADIVPQGASVFGRVRLQEQWTAFGRFDWFDPDANTDATGYRENLFIVGADFARTRSVHLMPNLIVKSYSGKAAAVADRDMDVTARMTLFWNFK